MKIGERLVGLALIGVGFAGFGLVALLSWMEPLMMSRPPLPPGMRPDLVPTLSPFNCLLPLTAIGSAALVLIGLRRLVLPD
jgi:hypothetical protein